MLSLSLSDVLLTPLLCLCVSVGRRDVEEAAGPALGRCAAGPHEAGLALVTVVSPCDARLAHALL